MAHLVCSMKLWVAEERVSAGRIDERVLKTPSIVLRSTLSAQNTHQTHQTYPRRKKICLGYKVKTEEKLIRLLKQQASLGTLLGGK